MKAARKRLREWNDINDDTELNESAHELRNAIAARWAHSKMTSKEVCELSYLITRPGAAKGLKDFAVSPESKGENYNRKLVRMGGRVWHAHADPFLGMSYPWVSHPLG